MILSPFLLRLWSWDSLCKREERCTLVIFQAEPPPFDSESLYFAEERKIFVLLDHHPGLTADTSSLIPPYLSKAMILSCCTWRMYRLHPADPETFPSSPKTALMVVPAITDETESAVWKDSSLQFVPTRGSGAGETVFVNVRIVVPFASDRVSQSPMTVILLACPRRVRKALLLIHHARVTAIHNGRTRLTDRYRCAFQFVGGKVVVTSCRTGDLTLIPEIHGDFGGCFGLIRRAIMNITRQGPSGSTQPGFSSLPGASCYKK